MLQLQLLATGTMLVSNLPCAHMYESCVHVCVVSSSIHLYLYGQSSIGLDSTTGTCVHSYYTYTYIIHVQRTRPSSVVQAPHTNNQQHCLRSATCSFSSSTMYISLLPGRSEIDLEPIHNSKKVGQNSNERLQS